MVEKNTNLPQIKLTQKEQEIFSTLLKILESY